MRKSHAMLALAGLLALAACNKGKEDEAVPVDNESAGEANVEEQQPVEAPPVLEPAPTNTVSAPPPPPPPPVTEDQQTLDDADATGMTSRLPDDYDPSADRAAAAQ
ncbi:MAG: hypothetical protein QM690_00385 [Sphingobium sp.]